MKTNVMAATLISLLVAGCSSGGPVQRTAGSSSETKDVVLKLPANYKDSSPYMISDRMLQEDQVIALFANDIARKGARGNGRLPYGSVLIGEIYKAKTDTQGKVIETSLGRRVPAELSAIVMMERRKGWDAQYPPNLKVGDWEFEVFSPAGKNLGKDTTACRECHRPLNDTEFTFSLEHIAAVN